MHSPPPHPLPKTANTPMALVGLPASSTPPLGDRPGLPFPNTDDITEAHPKSQTPLRMKASRQSAQVHTRGLPDDVESTPYCTDGAYSMLLEDLRCAFLNTPHSPTYLPPCGLGEAWRGGEWGVILGVSRIKRQRRRGGRGRGGWEGVYLFSVLSYPPPK